MGLVRFLFGFGWWVLLYAALYLWWLFSVVLWLFVFGQEAKPAGSTPNPASPASIMALMIAIGLGLSTLVTLGIALSIKWSIPLGIVVAALVAIGVCVGVGYLNIRLAEDQTMSSLYWNVAASALVILMNLIVLYVGLSKPAPPPLPV